MYICVKDEDLDKMGRKQSVSSLLACYKYSFDSEFRPFALKREAVEFFVKKIFLNDCVRYIGMA